MACHARSDVNLASSDSRRNRSYSNFELVPILKYKTDTASPNFIVAA